MTNFIKKNISTIIAIFILLSPVIDLITGLSLHVFKINLTMGIILRVIFLLFICFVVLFIFKKKKILIPYLIIGLYMILYVVGIIIYKEFNFIEIQGLVKVFYFPILLVSLYMIKEEIRISNMTLFTTLFLYLIFIFIPLILGMGFDSYEITKAGTLGFYNSANEISGIISILTPIMFIILVEGKNVIAKILLMIVYLIVILMMGTKTPLLTLGITLFVVLLYFGGKALKEKQFKKIIIGSLIILIGISSLILIIPMTNFYKNIETHLDYLKLDNVTEVFEDEELVDHFIFSQRLTFLNRKTKLYNNSSTYQKLFGIGYLKGTKKTKMIEMDYFDILYSHGIIGFIIFFGITTCLLFDLLSRKRKPSIGRYMNLLSVLLIIFLAFFTGHILTAPSVSLLVIIIMLSCSERKKKELLFASFSMDLGGIEKALLNLVNRIDYKKYNVTVILEDKKGVFLDQINKEVNVEELKVSNNKIIIFRKLINAYRKLIFKILNYHKYDFSCCYATYSYSSSKLALIASTNSSIYVHSNYEFIYDTEKKYKNFFDSRNIEDFRKIIFVSNEAKNSFLKYYSELKEKTIVLNNFIDIDKIEEESNEKIDLKKPNNTLFVFVGRLDDSSKKLDRAISLIKKIPNTELWIIGDGPDKETYLNSAGKNKKVKFLGKKSNPYPYMNMADYIILTSDYEGFPVVYLEALALNKQIVTTINTSDDMINMKDYAHIISKDNKMIEEVENILKKKSKKSLNLKNIQTVRMKQFEKLFNNEI